MILSAVMGIGLVSYGVAEPISHLATPPHGLAEPGTPAAAVRALQYSYFDWGLHAWAIFAVFGLAIAYSTYRKGRRTLVSQLFVPLLGDRVNGPIGKTIDVLAVFATLFGTTTSLGLGALQVNNGLGSLFGIPVNNVTQVLIIAAVTAMFTLSAVTGVQQGHQVPQPGQHGAGHRAVRLHPRRRPRGLRREPLHRVDRHVGHRLLPDEPAGHRFRRPRMDAVVDLLHDGLVGVLGRLRRCLPGPDLRGRTIRGFIMGVLVVPSVVFFTWFTVFGGTAIHIDMFEGGDIAERTADDINSAFFATLEHFPLATVTSAVAIMLVVMFFVSGADANTYVLSMMTSDGSLTPRRSVLILWGVLTGVTAVVLMLAGGLNALQNTVIVASLPFLVIIAGLAVSFWKELHADTRTDREALNRFVAHPVISEVQK